MRRRGGASAGHPWRTSIIWALIGGAVMGFSAWGAGFSTTTVAVVAALTAIGWVPVNRYWLAPRQPPSRLQ